MYENDAQSLKVFIKSNASTTVEIWNKTDNMPPVWNEARVEFSYNGEFQLMFEGTKEYVGHMALDDISVTEVCPATSTQIISDNVTSIGNTDSKKNQLSYGVYVGIAIGPAAILFIAGIVTLIIVRKKRRRQESQKKETIVERKFTNGNNHGDRQEEEETNISNQTPDGKCPESNEIHLNLNITTNHACAEIPDAQYDKFANTGHENTNILPYKQANISDYEEVDDVSNTRYEPLRQRDGKTYDHISGKDDYKNTT
ncbi:hypothetical protein ACJMK2_021348 [Sinanodonta woodiana]|uniref:MAM domain-containing protein n=1 Tax=Sinanodonta woodiana TaxID=1069815 RepID=A0ABD3TGI5_SINWO